MPRKRVLNEVGENANNDVSINNEQEKNDVTENVNKEELNKPVEYFIVDYPVTGYGEHTFAGNTKLAEEKAKNEGLTIVEIQHTTTYTRVKFRK